MTVRVHIQNELQIIIPLRFARAQSGGPVLDAPDIDDRGYEMARPGGLNPTNARGPMFGMTLGDTVRLKLVREDLDASAPLFATAGSSPAPQFEVVSPAAGAPVPLDDTISLRAIADTLAGQKLEIRSGAPTGPVIAEAEPHIFTPRTFAITPHVCTIHQGPAPSGGQLPSIGGHPQFRPCGGISVSRALGGTNTGSTLALRTVRIFLARSPGAPGTPRGIQGADWTLSNGEIFTDFGTTGADGLITLELAPGETAILSVLGTDYDLTLRLDPIEPANTLPGVQRRLRMLGYQLGDSGPDGNGVHPDPTPQMNEKTDRAILEFQADRNIKADGNVGAITRAQLAAAAGV